MNKAKENNEKEWKLIVDKKPLNGSLNMAVDDFLFRSLSSEPETYFRFYRWERPYSEGGRCGILPEAGNRHRKKNDRRKTGFAS